jgi:hypothetical protein
MVDQVVSVVSDRWIRGREARGLPMECVKCSARFVVGDVVTRNNSRSHRIYHLSCYEGMFIGSDVEEAVL